MNDYAIISMVFFLGVAIACPIVMFIILRRWDTPPPKKKDKKPLDDPES